MGYKDISFETLLVKNLLEEYPLVVDEGISEDKLLNLMIEHQVTVVPIVNKGVCYGKISIFSLLQQFKQGNVVGDIGHLVENIENVLHFEDKLTETTECGFDFYFVVDKDDYYRGAIYQKRIAMEKIRRLKRVAALEDITELEQVSSELETAKRLNLELETIINSSYDGLLITDENGIGIKINDSLSRMTGLEEGHFVGKNIEELFNTGVFHYQAVTVRALREGTRVSGIQKINTGREVLSTGNPVFDSEGRVVRVVTNVRDITELIRLEKELEETKALSTKYKSELCKLKGQIKDENSIITNSRKVKVIYELAGRVALSDVTVLILGESGVGKEGLARLIHRKSNRLKIGQFIQINCGAIPENLLESELFGYEAGAFTGANKNGKKGLFELANKGTIFLDEISELPLMLQVKLLRAIQEQEVYRVGGTVPIKLDVRILAASNKNLQQLVEEGKFREDLFYRLNVVPLELPPLRERVDDILPLTVHFLKLLNNKHKTNKTLSSSTLEIFQRYHWPGNIRELINVVERLIVTSVENVINIEEINSQSVMLQPVKTTPVRVSHLIPMKEAKQMLEIELVKMALNRYPTIRSAAEALGVTHSLIIDKISRYRLR